MIFFGDVSPAVGASLVALAIATVVTPTTGWLLQSRLFRAERKTRAEERAYDREIRAEERAHERQRWQEEKKARREEAMLGRRVEAVDDFRGHLSVVHLTTNAWQHPFRYGGIVPVDDDGSGERRAASVAINEALEGARKTFGRVRLFYSAESRVATTALRALNAALPAQEALHRVFIHVADIADTRELPSHWSDDERAAVRDGQQASLQDADAVLDEKVTALGEAITALADAARLDDDDPVTEPDPASAPSS